MLAVYFEIDFYNKINLKYDNYNAINLSKNKKFRVIIVFMDKYTPV
jgi:hypothetical protein